MITITKNDTTTNWVHGKTSDGFTFEAKVFDEPSDYGIKTPFYPDGGNISKLYVEKNGREIYCYDRGLDYSEEECAEDVQEIIVFLESRCLH